jgi:branched-chain amino acid aminotransferase
MGLNTMPCSVDVAIACWPWGAYLGDDAVTKGVRLKTSSWTRHDHNIMPPASKTTGNYVNSSLAKVEALKAGYDEALMLAPNGLIASARARTCSSAGTASSSRRRSRPVRSRASPRTRS